MVDSRGQYLNQQFGNYLLGGLLGTGGFAEVYLGEHVYLDTQAAIKVLTIRMANEDVEQFRKEARTIARLIHPNIVRVFDFGVKNGISYIVMDYAPNGSLRKMYPRGSRLPLQSIVTYTKQIAAGLDYAHSQRLIHRDVKADNMLIGRNGEILISDFGIAVMAHSTRSLNTHDNSGTISYMAPEQIQGKPRIASDQYSLGAVVYDWLSGAPPFSGTAMEVGMQHLLNPPPSLCERFADISPEVEQVVFTALAKDPQQRYTSIIEFAEALEQANKKIPVGTQLYTYRNHVNRINSAVWSPDGKSLASGGWDNTVQIWDAATGKSKHTYLNHSGGVLAIAWSPGGKYIASSDMLALHIWNASTGDDVSTDHFAGAGAQTLAWSPDANVLASGHADGIVQVHKVLQQVEVSTYRFHASRVNMIAWSPDGTHIASASDDGTVQVWQLIPEGHVYTYHGHKRWVSTVAWSPNGKHIASGGWDNTVQVWDTNTGESITLQHSSLVRAVAWSPDGNFVASGCWDGTVQVWNARSGVSIYIYKGHSEPVKAVVWSPDGKRIASAGNDKTVQVWQAI